MSQPRAIVLAPDVIPAALMDATTRQLLERWRDGAFKAVSNRELLIHQIRVLQSLGLSAGLLRRWTYWFTAPQTSIFLPDLVVDATNVRAICNGISAHSKAPVVCWKQTEEANWLCAKRLLSSL